MICVFIHSNFTPSSHNCGSGNANRYLNSAFRITHSINNIDNSQQYYTRTFSLYNVHRHEHKKVQFTIMLRIKVQDKSVPVHLHTMFYIVYICLSYKKTLKLLLRKYSLNRMEKK